MDDLKIPQEKETLLYNIKFEVKYFFRNIYSNIRRFFGNIKNLWKFRKIVWQDRWWDYEFLMNFIEFKLKDMNEHWGVDTHYVNDEIDKQFIEELIVILENIKNLEFDEENKIDELYEQFGIKLFGRDGKGTSRIRKLWD